MATLRFDLVAQDHLVYSGEVSEVIAPGVDGQLGILPMHAPLITTLSPGEVIVKQPGQGDLYFAVGGGWMEVRPDKVTVLARSAERSDEIDLRRAEAARGRVQAILAAGVKRDERPGLEMALRRSQIRLRVAQRRRAWRSTGPMGDEEGPGTQES